MPRSRVLVQWLFQGVYREEDLRPHLTAVRELGPRRENAYEHEYLYQCLGILDTKAQALLTYDAILMTAASIVLSLVPGEATSATALIVTALVASGVSSALCLSVIWLRWTDTAEFGRAEESFTRLLAIRNRRTLSYRISWVVAQTAALMLVVGISLQRVLV